MGNNFSGQHIRIQNRYAVMDFDSMEQAAESLSQIGVYSREEILKMLHDRVGYINGYVVTYQ